MTIEFYEEWSGKYIASWFGWTEELPASGDAIVLQVGINGDELATFDVMHRVFSGINRDKVKIIVSWKRMAENHIEADWGLNRGRR